MITVHVLVLTESPNTPSISLRGILRRSGVVILVHPDPRIHLSGNTSTKPLLPSETLQEQRTHE